MVQQSIIILALFNEFVCEHRGNNTYVIQKKTALQKTQVWMTKTNTYIITWRNLALKCFIDFIFCIPSLKTPRLGSYHCASTQCLIIRGPWLIFFILSQFFSFFFSNSTLVLLQWHRIFPSFSHFRTWIVVD